MKQNLECRCLSPMSHPSEGRLCARCGKSIRTIFNPTRREEHDRVIAEREERDRAIAGKKVRKMTKDERGADLFGGMLGDDL